MKDLQGTWDIVALEVEGTKMDDAAIGGSQVILKGRTFRTVGMGSAYDGTFSVDATHTPHTIDIAFTSGPHAGLKSLGIFTLKDDTWTLCLGMAGMSRPKTFATTPGSGHGLETLTRSTGKAKKGAPAKAGAAKPAIRSAGTPAASGGTRRTITVSPAMAEHGGEWSMVALDQSGQSMVPVEFLSFGRRVVRGDEMTVTMNGQVMLKVTFVVDTSTMPRSIDYTLLAGANKGKQQLGIYELDGDTARYCMAAPGGDRPKTLVTKGGDGRTLSVWKRT